MTLLDQLTKLKQVTKNKHFSDILNIAFFNEGKIWGTDLELSYTFDYPCKGFGSFEIDKAIKILRKTKSKDLEISGDADSVVMNTTKGVFTSKNNSGSDIVCVVPQRSDDTPKYMERFNAFDKFKKAMKFVTKDELRQSMLNVYLGKGHIVSTDAHKLYFERLEGIPESEVLVPPLLEKFFKGEDWVDIYEEEKYVFFELSSGSVLSIKKETSKYPNWKGVIPEKFNGKATLNRENLLSKIELCEIASEIGGAQLNFRKDGSSINSVENLIEYDVSKFESKLNVEFDEEISICFLSQHITAILKEIEEDEVVIQYNLPNKAVVINEKFLLMPFVQK